MSDEHLETIALANKLLDQPNADPDDDLRTLARQFLRAEERTARLTAEIDRMRKAIRPEHDRLRTLARKAGKRGKNETADELDERADAIDFRIVSNSGTAP